jgi:hypothetical protein
VVLYEEQDGKIDRKRMSKIETRHILVAPVQTEQTSEARGEEKPSKTGRKVSCPTPLPRWYGRCWRLEHRRSRHQRRGRTPLACGVPHSS